LDAVSCRLWETTFQFDRSYWSHEVGDQFVSQQHVAEDIGETTIASALDGYNCSILAYGQTGSGKSYSMMGPEGGSANNTDETELGLVPRMCKRLFDLSQSEASKRVLHSVSCSYLEIYNEQVFDLLASPSQANTNTSGSGSAKLRVREHPSEGVYVENLQSIEVKCYEDIMQLLQRGGQERRVAAHVLNKFSSRSHAILMLNLRTAGRSESSISQYKPPTSPQQRQHQQRQQQQRQQLVARRSKIFLVDLAGSERAKSTCCTGERLREASSINKSLSTLSEVIMLLARQGKRDQAVGEKDHEGRPSSHVLPYRNSVLTMLLRASLGGRHGNCRTTLLATISPVASSYAESMSTLRYALSAKDVVSRASMNTLVKVEGLEGG
jgi:hypothetical protein